MAIDLCSIVLTLRPLPAQPPEGELPAWWGRAAHALLLRVLSAVDPQLAASNHDEQDLRPFTASNLMGNHRHGLDPQQTYTLRYTAFSAPVTGCLLGALEPGGALAPGAQVELDYQPFIVEAATADRAAHPWAGVDDYASLAAGRLVSTKPAERWITLQFASPTAFKSGGMGQPLPLPELVFGSLLNRWNAYAPIQFPVEARRFASECLAISRFQLSSLPAAMKNNGLRVGAVGRVTYVALKADRYWMGVMQTLAAFARYGGVGAATTAGMGQVREWVGEPVAREA